MVNFSTDSEAWNHCSFYCSVSPISFMKKIPTAVCILIASNGGTVWFFFLFLVVTKPWATPKTLVLQLFKKWILFMAVWERRLPVKVCQGYNGDNVTEEVFVCMCNGETTRAVCGFFCHVSWNYSQKEKCWNTVGTSYTMGSVMNAGITDLEYVSFL